LLPLAQFVAERVRSVQVPAHKSIPQPDLATAVQRQQPGAEAVQPRAGKRKGAPVDRASGSQDSAHADEVRWVRVSYERSGGEVHIHSLSTDPGMRPPTDNAQETIALVVDPERDLTGLARDPELREAVSKASAELAGNATTSARASLAEIERVYDQLDAKIDRNIAFVERENKRLDVRLAEIKRLKQRFNLR
jgi:hypothetical protein